MPRMIEVDIALLNALLDLTDIVRVDAQKRGPAVHHDAMWAARNIINRLTSPDLYPRDQIENLVSDSVARAAHLAVAAKAASLAATPTGA